MKHLSEKVAIAVTCLSGIILIGLQIHLWGWLILMASSLLLTACSQKFRRHLFPVQLSLGVLGVTPISTNISPSHFAIMGSTLTAAIAIPYIFSRYIFRDKNVTFQWLHGRSWSRRQRAWIGFSGLIAYLIFPWYFSSTGVFHNWPNTSGVADTALLFIGTNALGIWDELFFINIVLGTFRRHLPFAWANIAQATIFTAFLYELGFRSFGPLFIFPFALIQGYVFKRVESLLYVIAIHLTVDLLLFLVLLHAYHPQWVPIFPHF